MKGCRLFIRDPGLWRTWVGRKSASGRRNGVSGLWAVTAPALEASERQRGPWQLTLLPSAFCQERASSVPSD